MYLPERGTVERPVDGNVRIEPAPLAVDFDENELCLPISLVAVGCYGMDGPGDC